MGISRKKISISIAIYPILLVLIQLMSLPSALDIMPESCPPDSLNCDHRIIALEVSNQTLDQAMEDWQSSLIFTSSFEQGHIVDRTLFMQFPDDIFYQNSDQGIILHSQSRLGKSDLGVNAARMDSLEEFLIAYEWS
ncbi:MAG TPA: DUF1499 domain-containing protein [Candidatus Poseidoniales archaeon]|nr:MAG: hypothetical protein CXT71_03360 [Euryarchaeota archaeon]HIF45637.1 DUF1499 domain-containing protein [Candidatus Poseidoniales archaeon]HIL66026.1 DUF1499 domain-containing protein [Candidatus Poseidoniales archaeon]